MGTSDSRYRVVANRGRLAPVMCDTIRYARILVQEHSDIGVECHIEERTDDGRWSFVE